MQTVTTRADSGIGAANRRAAAAPTPSAAKPTRRRKPTKAAAAASLPRLHPPADPNHVAFRLALTIRELRAADLDVTTAGLDTAGYSRSDRVRYSGLAAAIADALDQAEADGQPVEPPEALDAVYRTRRCAFQ